MRKSAREIIDVFAAEEISCAPAIRQGHRLLTLLHDAGTEKETVYPALLSYQDFLPDSLCRDFVADLPDFVCGWCAPQYSIWKEPAGAAIPSAESSGKAERPSPPV